jgi:hypothetical protein
MTDNPAIHRRSSGDVDIAVPLDGTDPPVETAVEVPEAVAVAASATAGRPIGTDTV